MNTVENKNIVFFRNIPVTFQISRISNPRDYALVVFVNKAVSKKAGRKIFTCVHVEQTRNGSRLVASDGKRMHAARISKRIKSGNYRVYITKDCAAFGKPLEDIRFPDWKTAVPEIKVRKGVIDLTESAWGRDQGKCENLTSALNHFTRLAGISVNMRYLDELTKTRWEVYPPAETGRPVLLRDEKTPEDVYAVLVPIRNTARARKTSARDFGSAA